ncbi:P-II family nitrogen regulator [Lachnospiraceae bacterium 54-53]
MKEINIFIRPEKLENVKKIFIDQFKCGGMTVIHAMGCGNQQGFTEEFTGVRTSVNLLPKLKVEVFVRDSCVEELVGVLCETLSTGHVGDGKIFVKNVEEAIRVRTGEHGEDAV